MRILFLTFLFACLLLLPSGQLQSLENQDMLTIDKMAIQIDHAPDQLDAINDYMKTVGITETFLEKTLLRELHFFRYQKVKLSNDAPLKLSIRIQVRNDQDTKMYGVSVNMRLLKEEQKPRAFGKTSFPVVFWEQYSSFPSSNRTLKKDVGEALTWLGRHFDGVVRAQNTEAGFSNK